MSRYIDADALIEACEQWKESVEQDAQDAAWNHGIDACINEIKHHAPTVNAVEVVRCKDCKWWDGIECQTRDIDVVDVDDFCSYGERKGGEDDECK